MLVRITNCCRMECSHCMIEASPEGQHMSSETFIKVLDLIERHGLMMLMVSGGEPLEHPQFFELMKLTEGRNIPIKLILSNGMFLEDEETRSKVIELGLPVQITNDPRFYPQRIPTFSHPLFSYENNIRTITTLGRAKTNQIAANRIAPMCFNLRSIVRQFGSFWFSVLQLRALQKFCIPSINVDGSIVAGESSCCYQLGTVESSDEELVKNLMTMKCNQCGLEDVLSPLHRQAIGV